jgi:gluconokinase
MNVFIGLDIGTTSTKAVAFDEAGGLHGEYAVGYPLFSEFSVWAEQEPQEIFDAVLTSMRETIKQVQASGGTVTAIGISTAMHALLTIAR